MPWSLWPAGVWLLGVVFQRLVVVPAERRRYDRKHGELAEAVSRAQERGLSNDRRIAKLRQKLLESAEQRERP